MSKQGMEERFAESDRSAITLPDVLWPILRCWGMIRQQQPMLHTHTHMYIHSLDYDGCPDANALQAENRWVHFFTTKWQLVTGYVSREHTARILLVARWRCCRGLQLIKPSGKNMFDMMILQRPDISCINEFTCCDRRSCFSVDYMLSGLAPKSSLCSQ